MQVSTKDDLGPGVVNMGHAQAVANAHNMTYIRTSAKENRNVTSLCGPCLACSCQVLSCLSSAA